MNLNYITFVDFRMIVGRTALCLPCLQMTGCQISLLGTERLCAPTAQRTQCKALSHASSLDVSQLSPAQYEAEARSWGWLIFVVMCRCWQAESGQWLQPERQYETGGQHLHRALLRQSPRPHWLHPQPLWHGIPQTTGQPFKKCCFGSVNPKLKFLSPLTVLFMY